MHRRHGSRRSVVCCLLVAAIACGFVGCAGYKLGEPGQLPFASIHVAPPINTSLAPQAAPLLGSAVIRALDRSGRVSVARENDADARLAITITTYRREVAAERSNDTELARKWRVTLTAECTLTNRRDGQAWFSRRAVSAFDEVYVDSGLVPAEYQNMPVLTAKLAQEISSEVLGAW